MRKTNSTAKLLNLPEGQQAQLAEWLLSGMPYHQARDLVFKEFAVEVKSLDAFSRFWDQVCSQALIAKRRRAAGMSSTVIDDVLQNPGKFDEANIALMKQRLFELLMNPRPCEKELKGLLSAFLKVRDQDGSEKARELAERQVKLAEQKYRDHVEERKRAIDKELAAATTSEGLSPETLEKIQKELRLL
jgi:hypothetical protein